MTHKHFHFGKRSPKIRALNAAQEEGVLSPLRSFGAEADRLLSADRLCAARATHRAETQRVRNPLRDALEDAQEQVDLSLGEATRAARSLGERAFRSPSQDRLETCGTTGLGNAYVTPTDVGVTEADLEGSSFARDREALAKHHEKVSAAEDRQRRLASKAERVAKREAVRRRTRGGWVPPNKR